MDRNAHKSRGHDEESVEASVLGTLNCSLSGQSYVRPGIGGSRCSPQKRSAQAGRISCETPRRRKVMSAAAHLCLMFSAYGRSPRRCRSACKIYLGQNYKVSSHVPCLSTLGVSGVPGRTDTVPENCALCMGRRTQETRKVLTKATEKKELNRSRRRVKLCTLISFTCTASGRR